MVPTGDGTGIDGAVVAGVRRRLLDGSPAAISVAEIIGALEGPIALTACVDGSDDACGVDAEQCCCIWRQSVQLQGAQFFL